MISGKSIPVKPLEVWVPQTRKQLGVKAGASRLAKACNTGESAQVPAAIVLTARKRRISRQLGFNGAFVQCERA